MSATGLIKSFPPEICSLICQANEPIFTTQDLNTICFISHNFRNEAQRILFRRSPCLRGTSRIRSWCLSLKRSPRFALDVESLVLFMPPQAAFHADDIVHLIRALRMCLNLQELAVFPEGRRQEAATSAYMLDNLPFTLIKFVNDYFALGPELTEFLKAQRKLHTLKLHSGQASSHNVYLPQLETLACQPQFSAWQYGMAQVLSVKRLRLDFEDSTAECESVVLSSIKIGSMINLKSLAIFLKKTPDGKQSHFLEIMAHIAKNVPYIKHLEIHQFLPTLLPKREPYFSFSSISHCPRVETLVLRPPPRLPQKAGDDPNLCAYVRLRTVGGRRNVAENIMETLRTLTRLVIVNHEYNYEFRRDRQTGIITGEELITLDNQEWASV